MQVIIGTKVGMTQIIGEDGVVTPITVLKADPATVTQIKTVESDGYNAVQLGSGLGKNLSKPVAGHVKKAGVAPKTLREFRTEATPELKLGDQITVAEFAVGDKVTVTGTSKGKGFAGTVKRWNFNESRNTHGFQGNIRTPTTPTRRCCSGTKPRKRKRNIPLTPTLWTECQKISPLSFTPKRCKRWRNARGSIGGTIRLPQKK